MVTEPKAVRISLLGRFEVDRGSRVLRSGEWPRRKAASLLQRLALERRLLKDEAIDFLWPNSDRASGANNLYRTLHALRETLNQALGDDTAGATFSFEAGILRLDNAVWVDVHNFERLADSSYLLPDHIARLEEALTLYQGDLLPDEIYADWTIPRRESLRQTQREIRITLAAESMEVGDFSKAVSLLKPLVQQDSLDEKAHRELMRAYAHAGRRHEALRQYQALVDSLSAELGMVPEPETTAAYAQIVSASLVPGSSKGAPRPSTPAVAASHDPHDMPLVGRNQERDLFEQWIVSAHQGQGRTILLAGESGIGKTRLAGELLRSAAEGEMTTLTGAAYEQEGQLPYQPFIEAINRYLVDQARPLTDNPITYFAGRGSGDMQQEQWALFSAAATFLMELAAQAPLVLLIDDLHAADDTSLYLFHYLARHTASAPVLLLATYRVDAPTSGSAVSALLNALYRERLSETLHLSALPQEQMVHLIEHTLSGPASPDVVSAIYDIVEGNPFFAQEITWMLLKSGQLEQRADGWHLHQGVEIEVPAGLNGVLLERVSRLGSEVEAALTAASVLGREFSFEVLSGVAPSSDDGELLDAIEAALRAHLLDESRSGYRFHHPLIRRVLYEATSRARRARLHARAAETIEAIYGRRQEGLEDHVDVLAHHYDLSDRRDRALDYLIRAGQKAANLFAMEVAADYYDRALALMDSLGLSDPARRWILQEQLGWWRNLLADTPRAVAHFEAALTIQPDERWQPSRADRARMHRGAAVVLITAGQTAAAEAHLSAALEEIDETTHASEYAEVLYTYSLFHWHQNEFQRAFEVAERCQAVAERLGDSAGIARAFEMLALACHSLGEWQSGIHYEEQRSVLAGPQLDVADAFDVHL